MKTVNLKSDLPPVHEVIQIITEPCLHFPARNDGALGSIDRRCRDTGRGCDSGRSGIGGSAIVVIHPVASGQVNAAAVGAFDENRGYQNLGAVEILVRGVGEG